jgi:hypothetical protein
VRTTKPFGSVTRRCSSIGLRAHRLTKNEESAGGARCRGQVRSGELKSHGTNVYDCRFVRSGRKAMMQRLERPQVDSVADVETNFLQAPVCIMVVPSARAAFPIARSLLPLPGGASLARRVAAAALETHSTTARPPHRCPDTRKYCYCMFREATPSSSSRGLRGAQTVALPVRRWCLYPGPSSVL